MQTVESKSTSMLNHPFLTLLISVGKHVVNFVVGLAVGLVRFVHPSNMNLPLTQFRFPTGGRS